jgi:DNA replication protein DnaC
MMINQLKDQLKRLKLSGMLEHIDLRLLESQQNQLSYSEFLSMLVSDEIEKRNMAKLARLIKQANMGAEKTLESFDLSFNPSINAAYIRELASCQFIEKGENIFFLGPTGTGKSHLAKAICHMACRKYLSVAFFPFYQLFNELNKATLINQQNKFMRKLSKIDLLAIDDFAFKKINQQQAEFLYTIIDIRYTVKSTILTSNRAMADWTGIFPDPIIANAILDRLAHNAHQITIKGESYRKKFKPKSENA